jgi:WD40 repeat protein
MQALAGLSPPPTSPYKGLAPFEDSELDEQLFFGREQDRDVIVANVVAARLTVLYGPTGVGKSSVLRAGVARDLRALADEPLVAVCDVWSEAPAAALAKAVAAAASIEPGPLADTIEIAAAEHKEIYLLLDQVEEYFVYHGSDPALGGALAELVTRPELPVHVLVAIREDALARLDSFKRWLPGLLANRLQLEHLSVDAGRQAILGPVKRFAMLAPDAEAITVEPALVDAVLAGVSTAALIGAQRGRGTRKAARGRARVETPYLQVVMQRVWEVEREAGSAVLRLSTLDALGGPGRIVAEHLERALDALTSEQKVIAARIFNQLVTPSGMKIAHGASDLAGYVAVPQAEIAIVLSTLARERILRPVHSGGSEPAYEIFHDVLADAVLAWRADFDARAAVAREREAARRRHRRLLVIFGIALIALVAMGATTLYAWSQRDQAQQNATTAKSAEQRANTSAAKATASENRAKKQTVRLTKQTARLKLANSQAKRAEAAARRAATNAKREAKIATIAVDRERRSELRAILAAKEATNAKLIAQEATRRARTATKLAQQKTAVASNALEQVKLAEGNLKNERNVSQSEAAAYHSQTALASAPVTSLALAAHAAKLEPALPLVESTLRSALLATRELRILDAGDAQTQPAGGTLQVAAVADTQAHSASFSPDGSLILTAGATGARLYHTVSGELFGALATGTAVNGSAFSKDGQTIALGEKGRVELWSTATRTRRKRLSQQGSNAHLAFSSDGLFLLTSGFKRARVWNVATAKGASHPLKLQASVTAAAIGPDGSRFLLAAGPETGIYDTATSALVFPLPEDSIITAARFSPAGDAVATAQKDGFAKIWNTQDGTLRCTTRASDGDLTGVAFNYGGSSLLTLDTQGDTRIWDAQTCQEKTQLVGHRSMVVAADFSLDDHYVVIAGRDRSARIFSLPDGTEQATLLGHTEALQSVAFSPDGTKVVSTSSDGTARLWDARIDRPEQRIGAHTSEADGVAIAPDGVTLASVGLDGDVRLWNLKTRRPLTPIETGVPLQDVTFSKDGKLVAAAGADGSTRLWNLKSHKLLAKFSQPGAVRALALSPDGTLLATAGIDSVARVFRLHAGKDPIAQLPHTSVVDDVAFSPDGSGLATATEDGRAQIWSVAKRKIATTFVGHSAAVNSVAFSPDGTLLATASLDHDARIWSVATGKTARVLEGHAASVNGVAFSADGRWVVTAGPGTAGVWATAGSDLNHDRLFFVSDNAQRIDAATFASNASAPNKWMLATAAINGSIATYTCALCAGTSELLHLAKQRLEQLKGD